MSTRTTNFEEMMNNHLGKIIRDVGEESFGGVHVYDCLKSYLEPKIH